MKKERKVSPMIGVYLPEEGIDLRGIVKQLERSFITVALARTNNNKEKASQLLGLKRTTLLEKMRYFGMKLNAPSGRAALSDA